MSKDVSVQTVISRSADKKKFIEFLNCWYGISDDMVDWLAGSCRATAGRLVRLDEDHGPDSYTIQYRTIVTEDEKTVSDTTLIDFVHLSYDDMIKFERWAIGQLDEMVDEFEAAHKVDTSTQIVNKRSKIVSALRFLKQYVGNKLKG